MNDLRPYEARIREGIQYKDTEFAHAMLRTWPDGRTCISRLNKKENAWVFVRLATAEDIAKIKRFLEAKKNAIELLGEPK